MSTALDSQRLGLIFQSRPDIIEGINRAADSPGRIALFNEIAGHVYDQLHNGGEPALKKRKVDTPMNANGTQQAEVSSGNASDEPVLLHIREISVSVPQRKKFEICLTQNFVYARAPGTTAPIPGITYAWKDIEYLFYLPVPEKAQIQHNYVLFPRATCLPSRTNPPTVEPLVFTVPATAPKEGTIGGTEASAAAAVSDTYKSLFHWAFDRRLRAAGNAHDIISADPNKFHSVVRQPHRPNERAVHVSGFRGSKDGYLFFLENGILWGFKKPLIFIPLNRIAAISYTNILQITFNMVVETFSGDGEPNEELEFGMLDQQDYGGIDDYVKRNRLQDRSMAEQRKAKLQLAENRGPKKGSDEAEGGNAEGGTELEKAQLEAEQQLQDDEDEDEEDYDPGSEGDSEGSGDSSDENGDDDDDDDDDGDGDGEEYDDDEEGGEEGEEEEEEEEEEVKPEPVSKPVQPAGAEQSKKTSQVPVRQGWATMASSRPTDDVDMEEKFEVM
ncbi:histone chaperone Rttp106-like protein [Metarhizium robertsii]|uniref:Histone chaperone Rttp106-like protein n=1 Tax=Metarhizium robertsii TaxID=568076 RepID=A0A0A1V4I3_9HYPO|nr:histone chaperone Rttp106-like protein [Metarhizium robertsii]